MTRAGIYRIVNTVSNTTYIGSSVNVRSRLAIHAAQLKNGVHGNRHLQRSWNKYGELAFQFESLISCERAILVSREQQFIDAYFDHDLPLFNVLPSFKSQLGFRYNHNAESRAKMSRSHKGVPLSPSHNANSIAGRTGSKRSLETRERMRLAQLGKRLSDETKAKIREIRTGSKASDEAKRNMSASKFGHPTSLETRNKIARALTGRKHSAETLERLRLAKVGYHGSSKLTWDDVRAIRAAFVPGYGNRIGLARRFSISLSTLKGILTGRKWKERSGAL